MREHIFPQPADPRHNPKNSSRQSNMETTCGRLHSSRTMMMIAKIASMRVGCLYRARKYLPPDAILYLFKTTIRPIMEYCLGWCFYVSLIFIRCGAEAYCYNHFHTVGLLPPLICFTDIIMVNGTPVYPTGA